jgi:hypothetical protein
VPGIIDYTTLSLDELRSALLDVGQDAQSTFGSLSLQQLNWKADATRWSVAQCFQHLLMANRLMFCAAREALGKPPSTVLQRMPLLPGIVGRLLIRSQSPETTRKFTAPRRARPTSSHIAGDIIQCFVDQHRDAAESIRTLDERDASRAIMISPFIRVVVYSVLDGYRLLVAHDRRHFEQARRLTISRKFPPT